MTEDVKKHERYLVTTICLCVSLTLLGLAMIVRGCEGHRFDTQVEIAKVKPAGETK